MWVQDLGFRIQDSGFGWENRWARAGGTESQQIEYIEHIEYIEQIENIDTLDTLNTWITVITHSLALHGGLERLLLADLI